MKSKLYFTNDHKLMYENEDGISIPLDNNLLAVLDRIECILYRCKKEYPLLSNRVTVTIAYYNHIITKEEYEFIKEYL